MVIKQLFLSMLTLILVCSSMRGLAADAIYTGFFSNTALNGYDAVSYFEKGQPEKGDRRFRYEYRGVYWQFSSKAHLQDFKRAPQKYIPRYGGFCAWAVATKKARAPGDPQYWKIVDGELYLNYSEKVQRDWLLDVDGHIKQADKNWPEMLDE